MMTPAVIVRPVAILMTAALKLCGMVTMVADKRIENSKL